MIRKDLLIHVENTVLGSILVGASVFLITSSTFVTSVLQFQTLYQKFGTACYKFLIASMMQSVKRCGNQRPHCWIPSSRVHWKALHISQRGLAQQMSTWRFIWPAWHWLTKRPPMEWRRPLVSSVQDKIHLLNRPQVCYNTMIHTVWRRNIGLHLFGYVWGHKVTLTADTIYALIVYKDQKYVSTNWKVKYRDPPPPTHQLVTWAGLGQSALLSLDQDLLAPAGPLLNPTQTTLKQGLLQSGLPDILLCCLVHPTRNSLTSSS